MATDRAPEDRSFAEAIVRTITQPLLVLDADHRIHSANPAFLRQFLADPSDTLGRALFELAGGQWRIPTLRRLLDEVLTGRGEIEDYRVEHTFDHLGPRVMLFSARRLEQPGHERLVLLAISDVTERERLRFQLEGRREFTEKLIDSIREGLVVLGWDLRVQSANQSFYQTFKVDPAETEGRLIYELGNRQWDIPRLRELLEHILPEDETFDDFEVEHEFQHIGRRSMLLNARRLDHEHLILLAIRDVTEERRAAAQQRALISELQHRVKNTLNNIRAISIRTRQQSPSLEAFGAAFDARLGALARAQDLMARGPLDGIDLGDLVLLELHAAGARQGSEFTVDGPLVRLSPRDAQAMAMTLHELTSNAANFGALMADRGQIAISWRIERQDAVDQLHFRWRERLVEISDTAPTRGYGSHVIEHSLPYMLGGSATLAFHPDGAECLIDVPLRSH